MYNKSFRKICLDTSPIIYFIEEDPKYSHILEDIFSSLDEGRLKGSSSYLTLLEILVKPIENDNYDLVAKYKDYLLQSDYLEMFPIEENIAEKAAELRAKYNGAGNGFKLKTPDAIQLSTAIISKSDVFLTNDPKLKNVSEITILVLDDMI